MKPALTQLKLPALISSALVLPFIVLELVNRRGYQEGFPFPLFGILWLLPLVFTLLLKPIARQMRTKHRSLSTTVRLLLGIALRTGLAWLWIGIVIDQMPCFLGVPLCD